jgi:hypothetical protein
MTTSWSHAMRGQWRQALSSNAGGSLLAVAAAIAAAWCLISAISGRWLVAHSERILAVLALLIAAVTLADWAMRLAMG